jgi:peroxiredoxin
VSFAQPSAHTSWAEEQGFQYELWTDDERTLALYYGAISNANAFFPDRITKVLNEEGTLILEYVDDVGVNSHPSEVLEDFKTVMGIE